MSQTQRKEQRTLIVYESSDWHIYPEGQSRQVRDWITEGKKEKAILIGNGDLSACWQSAK